MSKRDYQIALREDDLGLDDVVVKDVEIVHMERMDDGRVWLCCYLTDGQTIDFDLWINDCGYIEIVADHDLPDVKYEEQ